MTLKLLNSRKKMKEGFIEVSFPKNRKCLKILSELPDLFDSVGKDYELKNKDQNFMHEKLRIDCSEWRN